MISDKKDKDKDKNIDKDTDIYLNFLEISYITKIGFIYIYFWCRSELIYTFDPC